MNNFLTVRNSSGQNGVTLDQRKILHRMASKNIKNVKNKFSSIRALRASNKGNLKLVTKVFCE